MVEKKIPLCPKCKAAIFLNIPVKTRLERFGEAEIVCGGCGRPLSLKMEADARLKTPKLVVKDKISLS